MLDYGFANYGVYSVSGAQMPDVKVIGGVSSVCRAECSGFNAVMKKSDIKKVSSVTELPDSVAAPINSGEKIGRVIYKIGEKEIGTVDIVASDTVEKIDFWGVLLRMLARISLC